MCGRFASFLPPGGHQADLSDGEPLPDLNPSWNLAPSQDAPVVRRHPETGARHLDLLKWGLLPHFTTSRRIPPRLAGRSTRAPRRWRARACSGRPSTSAGAWCRPSVLRMAGQPEWQVAHAIARRDDRPMALAGLWGGPLAEWRGSPHLHHHHHARQRDDGGAARSDAGDDRGGGLTGLARRGGRRSGGVARGRRRGRAAWPVSRGADHVANKDADLLEPERGTAPPR